jgi:hypothetical protein
VREYKKLLEEKKYLDNFIINADESPYKFTDMESSKILMSARSTKQGRLSTPNSQLRTILPFVAASGHVWMIVLIYKYMSHSSNTKENSIHNNRASTDPQHYTNILCHNNQWFYYQ